MNLVVSLAKLLPCKHYNVLKKKQRWHRRLYITVKIKCDINIKIPEIEKNNYYLCFKKSMQYLKFWFMVYGLHN